MLYLAQVEKNEFLAQLQLRLLARQEAEHLWTRITEDHPLILLGKNNKIQEKVLILVELSPTGDVEQIEDATNWILNLIETYLSTGITPAFLKEEAERSEEWRKDLTLQSQELGRSLLELEARREQIEGLEESRQRERNGDNSGEGN